MKPAAKITINGREVATEFNERLVDIQLTDNEGFVSDSVRITLRDKDPFIFIPNKGDIIAVWLGYQETGLAYFGSFVADDPEVNCLPYTLTVSGKGADMKGPLKEHKERHWDDATVEKIVQDVAKSAKLTALVAAGAFGHVYKWFAQQDESDIHFLERLARRWDAVFSVKDGKLIFAKKGSGQGPDGGALTSITADPRSIVPGTCRTQFAHRFRFRRVLAYTQDILKAKRVEFAADGDSDGEADFHLGEPFADEGEAQAAAQATSNELQRNTTTTTVELLGDPRIRAGAPFRYQDVRPQLDGLQFIIDTATHSWSKSGYRTRVDGKLRVPRGDWPDSGSGGADPSQGEGQAGTPDYSPLIPGAPE